MSTLIGKSTDHRKNNKEEFHQNQLLLKSLIDSSHEIMIRAIDTNYCYLFFNSAYKNDIKKIYGTDIAVGMNMFDCINRDDDRKKIKIIYDRVFSGESYNSIEAYGENENCYYENYVYPIKNEKESIIGAVCFSINASDRKKAEEALRQTENQFTTLFMSIADGFYLSEILYDDHGAPCDYRYLEVNPVFERIMGLRRDQIIGKRYKELVPVDTTQWLDNYHRVARTGEPSTYEFYSEEYKMHFETYAYKTAKGQIAVFVRNVTERKRTENALQNSQKLESLGILAGGIAHDFNNMLCSLFGSIDLARGYLSSGNVHEAIDTLSTALQSLDMLKSLTNQLLTFSKGGAPCRKIIPIGLLIKNSCMLALSGSTVRYQFDMASDLAACECDKNQIAQVLTNIVINAKQAMPSGGMVSITAKNVFVRPNQYVDLPEGGKYIQISITDHGIGIPQHSIKNIFDPFFTTKETGHGLGLSTAFSIIKRHNGLIEVESEPGSGSTFRVFLPSATLETDVIPQEKTGSYTGKGSILVMDDDEFVRTIYRGMIQLTGHTVVEAKNGEEAIKLFKEAMENGRPFVMTFLDLTVKGGTGGRETLLEIRKLQPDAIVVVASGYANDPSLSLPLKNGFNDSLPKPFTRDDMTKLFLRIFGSGFSQSSS